jgi:glycosyltransferase involved in cell wall biosynthesis
MNIPMPTASIIIPCRNEIRFIERCLASVFAFEAVSGNVD